MLDNCFYLKEFVMRGSDFPFEKEKMDAMEMLGMVWTYFNCCFVLYIYTRIF